MAFDAVAFSRSGGVEGAVSVVRRRAGKGYDPRIAERFCRDAPSLLAGIDSQTPWELVLQAEPGPKRRLSNAALDEAVRAIADFADLKSPYTAGHSSAVAELAAAAARRYRLPQAEVTTLWRAGMVHEIGQVGVSASIWDKPGPLTQGEWERVRLHPYYTARILARPLALASIGSLGSQHHERLDGSGYHLGTTSGHLSLASRILAAACGYQTKISPRPHRPALEPSAAAQALRDEVRAGRLDGEAAEAVRAAAGHRAQVSRRAWPSGLSDREVEVLGLIAGGVTNREIAQRLSLSRKTVDTHVQHIYNKIGISTRAAAALFAMQHDLLPPALHDYPENQVNT